MKFFLPLALLGLSISTTLGVPFQNLDFEAYDPSTGLVPGWMFENQLAPGPTIRTHLPLDYAQTLLNSVTESK